MKALRRMFGSCASDDKSKPSVSSPMPASHVPPTRPKATPGPHSAGTQPSVTPGPPSAGADRQPLVGCSNGCGWTAFPGHSTCCRRCKGPDGPHAEDCIVKNERYPPLCFMCCGRPAFGAFKTCCKKCEGPEGPHSADCESKAARTSCSSSVVKKTRLEIEEELRQRIAEWQATGAIKTRAQVDDVVGGLATSSGMEREAVRMLWLSVARQARPVGAPVDTYAKLTKQHHGIDVEVIDLGQYSAKHSNSCMFLVCSAALADRRSQGYEDAILPGLLGDALLEAAPDTNAVASIDELIEQHRRNRSGTLGRMADALRHAACEVLQHDSEFFRPFFHPVRLTGHSEADSRKAYDDWVAKLRGDEEGDELVILALARLIGMAVQPVQQSGYRVPLMDPTGAADTDCISYWGNDDRHWVWMRPA